MIEQKVDNLILFAAAATLQTAVVFLKWMRRSETGSTNLPKAEGVSNVPFPA